MRHAATANRAATRLIVSCRPGECSRQSPGDRQAWQPGQPPSPVKPRRDRRAELPPRWGAALSSDPDDGQGGGWGEAALLSRVRPDTLAMVDAVFDSLDTNHDGRIDAEEWAAAGGGETRAEWS